MKQLVCLGFLHSYIELEIELETYYFYAPRELKSYCYCIYIALKIQVASEGDWPSHQSVDASEPHLSTK
jgi:hypothetical protein